MSKKDKNESTETALTKTATQQDMALQAFAAAGVDIGEFQGAETIQVGGVTKWVALKEFQEDPNAPEKSAVKGNGKAFAGVLLSRQEIEVPLDENGEERTIVNADGEKEVHKFRFFYLLRLLGPCPVSYKDDDNEDVAEIASAGEIVAIGERHGLKCLRPYCDDGGQYAFVVQPHSRRKISATRTMWTFNIAKKVIRQGAKLQIIPPGAALEKAPF